MGALTHSASLYLRDAASDKIRWQPCSDASFALGLNTHEGQVTCGPVAEAHGLPLTTLAEVLS